MDDVLASFDAYAARIEPTIIAGQAAMTRMAAAFIRAYGQATTGAIVEVDADPTDIVGTTKAGESLRSGMAAWGPMVLGRIADGATVDDARDFGRFLAERFTDGELTGAADREIARQADVLPAIVGVRGFVAPEACDPCQGNAGDHELGWDPYRHGGCNCVTEPIFGAS